MKKPESTQAPSMAPDSRAPGTRQVGPAPKDSLDDTPDADPQMQGEGNITAARRHRKSAEKFVESGAVDRAARDAAPANDEEARQLREAEAAGKAPGRP